MELNLQQRVCIKFCVKNGFNGVKTLEILGNFGSDTLKKTAVYEWHEKTITGNVFNSRKEVMENLKTALMAIPTIEFQKCFESWIKRWHKCVAVDGEYFEGDNITFDE